jgi:hypothetical protein
VVNGPLLPVLQPSVSGWLNIFSNIVPYRSVVVSTKCLDTRGGMNMKTRQYDYNVEHILSGKHSLDK